LAWSAPEDMLAAALCQRYGRYPLMVSGLAMNRCENLARVGHFKAKFRRSDTRLQLQGVDIAYP
jgi:hypothetical protein